MIKNIFLSLIVFAVGFLTSHIYRSLFSTDNLNHHNTEIIQHQPVVESQAVVTHDNLHSNAIAVQSTKIDVDKVKSPKTSYEFFKLLESLDTSSPQELKNYLATIGSDQIDVRNNIAWFLAAKYPEEALDYINTLMNTGDIELAKITLNSLGQNHAKLTWDWIGQNENEMDNMYKNIADKNKTKLLVLNMLATIPDYKWVAYEEAKTLIANGPQKADKYQLMGVAQNAASSDVEDAINHATSAINGKRDSELFNGAVNALISKDIIRAKNLVLQNQDLADAGSITSIEKKLLQANQFSDAYDLVNNLTNKELKKSVINTFNYMLIDNGLERTKEFANTITSDELRFETVNSMVIGMAVNGQPVKDQLALMDTTFETIPIEKKSFNYAYTMRDWIKTDPSEYNIYIQDVRSRDKPLADAIEKNVLLLQKK